jgi:hypothetical protein
LLPPASVASNRAPPTSPKDFPDYGILSDDQVEYQVRDRLSFTRFLGLGIKDGIPDGTTLWLLRGRPAADRPRRMGRMDSISEHYDLVIAQRIQNLVVVRAQACGAGRRPRHDTGRAISSLQRSCSTRLAGSVRDRVIVTNLATSSSPIDNSTACRHAVMTLVRSQSKGHHGSRESCANDQFQGIDELVQRVRTRPKL